MILRLEPPTAGRVRFAGEDIVSASDRELMGYRRQVQALFQDSSSALSPRMLVLDEPVSALDVSVRSQVLNLLLDLQREYGLTYVMIAHDLAVLRHVTTRLLVMYQGRVIEEGPTEDVLHRPREEYTRRLVAAVPKFEPGSRRWQAAI